MRRATVALLAPAVALCAALAGCSGGGDQSATPSTSEATARSTAAESSAAETSGFASDQLTDAEVEAQFGDFVESQGYAAGVSQASAVQLGRAICLRYDTGGAYVDVEPILTDGGLSAADAGGFNAAAIVAFCPEHAAQIGR